MKKCLAFAGAVLVLAPAVFLNTAAAFQSPARRTAGTLKKPVDFTAKLNGSTNSLGKTGIVPKIQSAAIAQDGTITVRVTTVDSNGIPLDRLGVATPGPVSMSFIAAYIPAGQSQYVAYTTSVSKPSLNLTMPPQTQAANDSGGKFTTNDIGDYTYTFKTKAPATFDATVTTSIGVSAQRDLSAYGTFDEWSETGNDVFNFVPNGSPVKVIRQVATTAACNQCHNPLIGHGGSRLKVELCIMCHQPQTINADTGLTQDMKVLIHKIHMGSSLPSVIAGTPYRIWHRGAWSDFSTVQFPQDVRNCTTCHGADAAQGANYKTNPSAAACGSCHDDVNLATGLNHGPNNAAGPQPDDKQCASCHPATQHTEFDSSVPGAHLIPTNSAALAGIVTKFISVTNATPGNSPTIQFSVMDKSGNPIDITKLTSFRFVMAGDNVDYAATVNGMARASETTVAKTATGSKGVYTYTMTNKIPTTAKGSYTLSIEASNTVTLMPGTNLAVKTTDAAAPVEYYFSVDNSPVVARRKVVDPAKCGSCHENLGFVHGGTRANTQECVICHNPTLTDGTSNQSVNLAWQIHSIHRGENLANPYVLGTTNYQDVRFPGDLRDCTACHLAGTYMVENVGAKALVASPGGFTKTTPPISAACQGCHDDIGTASHALANTTVLGESCTACHSAGEEFSVDRVHQRIF
jgi:OmcA/MtrC family decaheme c-type cytochrome